MNLVTARKMLRELDIVNLKKRQFDLETLRFDAANQPQLSNHRERQVCTYKPDSR